MDVEKLIDRLKNYSIKDKALLNLQTVKDAAEALAALQSELEKVKAERDDAISFIEYLDHNYSGYLEDFEKWRGQKED